MFEIMYMLMRTDEQLKVRYGQNKKQKRRKIRQNNNFVNTSNALGENRIKKRPFVEHQRFL